MRRGEEQDRIGRREFSRQIAAGAGLLGGIATVSTSVASPRTAEDPPVPKKGDDPKSDAPEPPPPPAEVLLLNYLIRKYPSDKFDDQALQGIFRDIRGDVARGKALASFPLKNSDEPVFTFRAYRSADGTPTDK